MGIDTPSSLRPSTLSRLSADNLADCDRGESTPAGRLKVRAAAFAFITTAGVHEAFVEFSTWSDADAGSVSRGVALLVVPPAEMSSESCWFFRDDRRSVPTD